MYRGELASAEARRSNGRPSPSADLWEAMRCKSALPSTAVAVLALLANPLAGDGVRDVVETAAAYTGEAFWIADDLTDVRSDWDAGCWSRPLWLLLRAPGDPPASAEDAIQRLLRSGIAASEAQRLRHALVQLTALQAALPGVSERSLLRPVQAAVRSWLEEIPLC